MIVNGQFVDPAPYVSEKGGNSVLVGEALVAFRQWQQDVRAAGAAATARSSGSAACQSGRSREPQPVRRRAAWTISAEFAASGIGSAARRCAGRFDRLEVRHLAANGHARWPTGVRGNHEGKDRMFNKYMAAGVAAATLVGAAGTAHAGKDLDAIKARGQLICGVSTGVAGFAVADSQGKWTGLDVDVCRAVAAAIFGDAEKVKYRADSRRSSASPRCSRAKSIMLARQHDLDADPRHRARPRLHRRQLL